MPKLVVDGATLNCDQGAAPATLKVLPLTNADNEKNEAATVDHYKPMVNIAASSRDSWRLGWSTSSPVSRRERSYGIPTDSR